MIYGIGVDSIEIERVAKLLAKPNLTKLFSPQELEYATLSQHREAGLAGCFAAKEAVVKALGSGFSGLGWREVEISHEADGRPLVCLSGRAAELADRLGIVGWHLSISHDQTRAVAFAVAELAAADKRQASADN